VKDPKTIGFVRDPGLKGMSCGRFVEVDYIIECL